MARITFSAQELLTMVYRALENGGFEVDVDRFSLYIVDGEYRIPLRSCMIELVEE
jgi:hypothetical protein